MYVLDILFSLIKTLFPSFSLTQRRWERLLSRLKDTLQIRSRRRPTLKLGSLSPLCQVLQTFIDSARRLRASTSAGVDYGRITSEIDAHLSA